MDSTSISDSALCKGQYPNAGLESNDQGLMNGIVVLGPPMSGKSLLSRDLHLFPHMRYLSIGDVFRNIPETDPHYELVHTQMRKGDFVPDALVFSYVDRALEYWSRAREEDPSALTVLFDGVPQVQSQVAELAKRVRILGALHYRVDVATCMNRPHRPWRKDSEKKVVEHRFRMYAEHTEPLVERFDVVYKIDATMSKTVTNETAWRFIRDLLEEHTLSE